VQLRDDLSLGDDIEGCRRLVHDHEFRLERQSHGDHDALALTTGEFVEGSAGGDRPSG
jgi:hypothetical protein